MVRIVYEPERFRTCAYDDKKTVGECTYSNSDKIWIINHTQVAEEYAGQGIVKKLVKELAEQARKADVKIIPLCPFAKKEFEENEEYLDVWKV